MAKAQGRIGNDLTEGSIAKKLVIYALPLLLTNFVQQLYNTVDMAIIGHYVGSVGTVGVSTGGDVATFLTFVGTAFGQAGQVYIAQLAGARQLKKISFTIGTLLTLMFLVSSAFAIISIVFCEQFLQWLNCPEEAFQQAKNYMIITSLGMPFVFEYNAIAGCLRGMGESKRPLLFVSIAAVSNIIMDVLFVAVIPLEAAGTAIATVAAQVASCVASLVFMYKRKEHFDFDFKLKSFRIYKEQLLILLKLGIPMAARTALIQLTQMYCGAQINSYGLTVSATNSVGKKISKLVNIFNGSIDGGAGAMIGQCLGAEKYERAKKTVYVAMAFCSFFCLLEICLALFAPTAIFRVFTPDEKVLELGKLYMRITIIKFVLQVFQGPYQAMVTGSGFASLGFVVGILDGVVLRLAFSLGIAELLRRSGRGDMSFLGFFYGDALAHLGAVIPSMIYFYSGKWRTFKLLKTKKPQLVEKGTEGADKADAGKEA